MEDRVKILYLITGLKTGGAEMVLRNLVDRLDEKKFDLAVVSIIPIGEIGEEIKRTGISVSSLNIKSKYNIFALLKLIFVLKKEKPTILHLHLFHAILLGRIAGRICGVPIIISSIHGENISSFLRNLLLRISSRLDNIVTVVSNATKRKIIESRITPSKKIIVVYNGVDTHKFSFQTEDQDEKKKKSVQKELKIAKTDKILISVGRLSKEKGFLYLVGAINILKNKYPNVILIILGEGKERHSIKKEILALGLEKNIFLLGEKKNISDYLNISKIFVLPSIREGFGLAIIEAMACGLPVVATNVGGIPEVIKDKLSGFLVEPKNSIILAKKIEYLLNLDIESRKKMGMRGRKIVEEKFSLEKMVKNYENLYEKLLAEIK